MDYLTIAKDIVAILCSIGAIWWANLRTNPKHLDKVSRKAIRRKERAKERLTEHVAKEITKLKAMNEEDTQCESTSKTSEKTAE